MFRLIAATFIFGPSGGQTICCANRGTVHLEAGKYAGGNICESSGRSTGLLKKVEVAGID
jgi:hypothetical protein